MGHDAREFLVVHTICTIIERTCTSITTLRLIAVSNDMIALQHLRVRCLAVSVRSTTLSVTSHFVSFAHNAR